MPKHVPAKEAFVWRPSDLAWLPLFQKHERERRPINQILNDIVIDYFTPKLFNDVPAFRHLPEATKAVAKGNKPKKTPAIKTKNKV